MNTKKAVWISRPDRIKATLHSLSFHSTGTHSVFFILGEEGEISLSYSSSAASAIVLLHTPEEYIVFGKERIVTSFGGVRTAIPYKGTTDLRLIKNKSHLSFVENENEVLSIDKAAFSSSISFGIAVKGEGDVSLEVF